MLTGKILSHSEENVHDPKPTPFLSTSPETQNLPLVAYKNVSLDPMVWKFNLWYLIWCVTWHKSPSIVLEMCVGGDDSEFCSCETKLEC